MGRAISFGGPLAHVAVWLMVLLGTCFPGRASGEGVRDFTDGWLLNPGDSANILAEKVITPPVGGDSLPVLLPAKGWGWWAGAGQGALFSMDDLPQTFLEGGIINRGGRWPWAAACSWERLGDSLIVEETGSVQLRLGRTPQIGIRMKARRWLVENQKVDEGLEAAVEGRLVFRLAAGLSGNLSLWLHPGPSVQWHRGRGRRTLAEIKIFHSASGLAVRLDQRGDGAPVLAVEFMVGLSSGLGLGFRADPETGSLAGSLVARVGGPWLRTSHLVHPALGVTHRFHLGAGDPAASIW
jgi:hypothetical protein